MTFPVSLSSVITDPIIFRRPLQTEIARVTASFLNVLLRNKESHSPHILNPPLFSGFGESGQDSVPLKSNKQVSGLTLASRLISSLHFLLGTAFS